MKKPKIFIACDTTSIKKIKKIITNSQSSKINFGYKFGLEFLNSKNGRKFLASLKSKVTFGDYKLADIPNTCASTIKAVRDLKLNYITIHIYKNYLLFLISERIHHSSQVKPVSTSKNLAILKFK